MLLYEQNDGGLRLYAIVGVLVGMSLYDRIVSRFLFAVLKKAGKWFKIKKMNKKMVTNKMSSYGRSKRVKREKWANRMAVLGVTMVVICLAAAVNAKGSTLKKSDLDYQQKEQQLEAQLRDEEERTKKLEEYKVYVKTKQFAEEVAKEKLGLVNPDEILLKPNK